MVTLRTYRVLNLLNKQSKIINKIEKEQRFTELEFVHFTAGRLRQ